jgi:hypothetical protein
MGGEMYAFRRISLPAHGLVELIAGLALVTASLAIPAGTWGMVAMLLAGVLVTGVGLGAAESLPLAAHQALDRWLATLMAAASIGLALAGDVNGAVVLLGVAAGQLLLGGVTRWTRAPVPHL